MAAKRAGFRAFKYGLYGLLFVNVFLLLTVVGDAHKAVDQVGWLLILSVFEWETRTLAAGRSLDARGRALAVELGGYGCALYALGHYIADRNLLDIVNSLLWLGISAMIWADILHPVDPAGGAGRSRGAVKAALYAGVFACAVAWGLEGSIIDFYDAVLWILCFFVIELNILGLADGPRRGATR